MSRVRAAIVMAIGIALIIFMIMTDSGDLLLILGRVQASAMITQIHQPPPGRFRESDYDVTYDFVDDAGVHHIAKDLVPPAFPPGQVGGFVEIAYSRHYPSVSRIASQVSSTPIGGVLMGLIFMMMGISMLFRASRRDLENFNTKTSGEPQFAPAVANGSRTMKCPKCAAGAITFGNWVRGLNAFFYTCPHCGTNLRAGVATLCGFASALLSIPILIWAARFLSQRTEWPEVRWFIIFLVAVTGSISYATWRIGSYVVRSEDKKSG